MKNLVWCMCMFCGLFIIGCNEVQLTDLQIRDLQSKDLQGTFDSAYKATLQVVQDYGYVIKNSDYNSGVIQGEIGFKKDKNFFWNGVMNNTEITTTLEQFTSDIVKGRISIIQKKRIYGAYNYENTEKVIDASLYQKIYDDIQKEIFIRQNINK